VEQGAQVRLLPRTVAGRDRVVEGGRLVPEKIFIVPPPLRAAAAEGQGGVGAALPVRPPTEPRLRVIDPGNKMVVIPGIGELRADLGRLYIRSASSTGSIAATCTCFASCAGRPSGPARDRRSSLRRPPEELIEGLAPPLLCDRTSAWSAPGAGVE